MIVGKLLGELMRVKEKNPKINLEIDVEILKMFSDQYRQKNGLLDLGKDGRINENISKIYSFYDNFLNSLGGSSLTGEQQLIYTAALEERLLISSLAEEANLQIRKAQEISNQRGEAFKIIQQSYNDLMQNFTDLEKRLVGRISGSDQGIFLDEFKAFRLVIDSGLTNLGKLGTMEPVRNLNTIGSGIIAEHMSKM